MVDAVLNGESADQALAGGRALGPAVAAVDAAALQAIALGTIRWCLRLAPAIDGLLARPSAVAHLLRALLMVGAHQVEYSRHAPEATVDAAVDASRLIGLPRAASLVNAVLRRFVAERAGLLARVDADPAGRTAHPPWLVRRISEAWPQQAAAVLQAGNEHPPMTLRVDLSRVSVPVYLSQLAERSISAHSVQWMPSAVTLDRPCSVQVLPGFLEGIVSVQDAGAQLAAYLLDVRPAMRVLDACAAPGGKTGHLLERLGTPADVTAIDVDAGRIALIIENLGRLRRAAHVVVGDARDPASFWDGKSFDRILVDAPCSATGVIRRHPDIKLLRRDSDIGAFAATQLSILRAAARLLAPGGRLLYSTCSILPEENEQVVAALLALEPALRQAGSPAAATLPPGLVTPAAGLQLLPGAEAGTDGFYYACLEKTTAGP